MIIRSIWLHNYVCFRGDHKLKLGPGIYAITAQYENDPDGSNAAGKTSILEAVELALFGFHRWRYEDDWITRGEDSGFVDVQIGDTEYPIAIHRSRQRGKSTQLVVECAGNILKGDEAQLVIEGELGLSHDDYCASAYLRQKQHSAFVTGDPADRRRIISGWFDLEKLVQAEKYAKGKADEAQNRALSYEATVRAFDSSARALVLADTKDVFADLQLQRKELETYIQIVEARKRALAESVDQWKIATVQFKQYAVVRDKRLDCERRLMEIAFVKDDHAGRNARERADALQVEVDEAVDMQKVTRQKLGELRRFQVQGFDGVCPVTKGQCPVPEHVNACKEAIQKQLEEAQTADKAANALFKEKVTKFNIELKLIDEWNALKEEEVRVRQTMELLPTSEVTEDPGPCPEVDELAEVDLEHVALLKKLGMVEAVIDRWKDRDRAIIGATTAHETERQWQTVRAIFSRNGAQRVVAEEFMHDIEASANRLLLNAGIRLQVQISWAHDTGTLVEECEACGYAFVTKTETECAKCGQKRPNKFIQRLEVVLSDRSGAFEDLAGMAIQLAASEWLRETKESQWAVLMLDEPFGSLDKTNRLAMSTGIVSMLGSWEQAFVISHTADTALAMPKRIEVLASENGSSVKVVQ